MSGREAQPTTGPFYVDPKVGDIISRAYTTNAATWRVTFVGSELRRQIWGRTRTYFQLSIRSIKSGRHGLVRSDEMRLVERPAP